MGKINPDRTKIDHLIGARSNRGRKMLHFDAKKLVGLLDDLAAGHIHYRLGKGKGKVSHLSATQPEKIRFLDCSGYAQYVIYKASQFNVRVPQGSWRQEDWVKKRLHRKVDYAANAGKIDDIVRIAFREKTKDHKVRHVWLVINGKTYECAKSRRGPTSYDWKKRTKIADSCYVLGSVPDFALFKILSGMTLE